MIQGLRTSKQATRQESRYRLIVSHRPNFTDGENTQEANGAESNEKGKLDSGTEKDTSQKGSHDVLDYCGEFQLLDIVQEDMETVADMPATFLQVGTARMPATFLAERTTKLKCHTKLEFQARTCY